MNKDHLVIHKERGICASGVYHYLVNTYYDYVLSFSLKHNFESI